MMPGQTRGSKRGRGASRGGGRGGGRGRSSSRGGGGRQNTESFPRGRNARRGRGRGGAEQGSDRDGTWRKESGSVHLSTGIEMQDAPSKKSDNKPMKVVVKEESSRISMDKQPSKKSKKPAKNKSGFKETPARGDEVNDPTVVKMPEQGKPHSKPVKNVKIKTLKESHHNVPARSLMLTEDVAQKLPPEASINLLDDIKLNISRNTSLAMNTSYSTGLKVLSITSSLTDYVFTTNDRAKLVRSIPGVVIINTANKGDKLIIGVDMEDDQFSSLLGQLEELKNWNVSCLDITDKDTFSYFSGWNLIPRVDKSGMFQLIVNLRTQGWRSKDAEMKQRNQLLDLVKDFNITKIVHGEGETILLVSHVLECVAYSDLIRKQFKLEKRHTWQPKPVVNSKLQVHQPGQERHFWVKVKDPELNNLTTAHKQYTVYHQLSSAGKVLQLEHKLFRVEDNYLVVFSDMGDAKMPVLGQQFCLLELLPDALPDCYTPSYGVDAWGFYSVSGKFPEDVSDDARNRFAEDMKKIGAVGFRSGEVEDSFSLHFVNSRCLEQISRCAQFSSFRLTILSSLVRKTSFEKKLMKMVPSILKYKELKLGGEKEFKQQLASEGDAAKSLKKFEDSKFAGKDVAVESKSEQTEVEVMKEDEKSVKEIKSSKKMKGKVLKEKVKSKKEVETLGKNEGHVILEVQNKNEVMMEMAKEALKNCAKTVDDVIDERLTKLTESDLLRICWKREGSLQGYLVGLSNFLISLKETVSVVESSEEVVFSCLEKKIVEVLAQMGNESTNTLEKMKAAPQKVQIQASRFFKNKFGLVVEKSSSISQLQKDFSKFGVEIEVRSQVFVLWFESKLSFYKALTDTGTVGYKMVPCVQNFQVAGIQKNVGIPKPQKKVVVKNSNKDSRVEPSPSPTILLTQKKVDNDAKKEEVPEVNSSKEETEPKICIQLSEREVFGFIWQKTSGKANIRDDQVISRQLTNFIKTVSCEDMSADEDGLIVKFSTQAEKTAALSKFCPAPVPSREELDALSRKFTLLPTRGFFGLFSVKRVKPEHFTRFGDCKIRNCGIWFSDKLSMFTVLRDPFISKTYPTLFLDCRNIYILSSVKSHPQVNPDTQEKPAASSSLKLSHVVTHPPPCPGVVTRSAIARMSAPNDSSARENEVLAAEAAEKLPSFTTAMASPLPLNTLHPKQALTVLGQGKFGFDLGKVWHIPSDRLGKMSLVEGSTLREIKMKRVEHFIKDKLGVQCRLSQEGKEKLKAGGMIIENKEEKDELGQEMGGKEVTNSKTECKTEFEDMLEKKSEVEVENIADVVDGNQEDERKQKLLKKEAERREFVKQALIFPDELVHEVHIGVDDIEQSGNDVAQTELELVEKTADESPNPSTKENVEHCPTKAEDQGNELSSKNPPSVVSVLKLTPDLIGFYTLTLPVPQGSDLTILTSLQEDISWFDSPVSILCMEGVSGGALLEVRFRNEDMAVAVLQGLKHKYVGLAGDEDGNHADIVKDKETGLFTLCFTDSKRKRFKATMEKFKMYSKLLPVISRGLGADQVLVAFHTKEEAVLALKENFDNEEFPELHVAPVSRG